MDSRWFLAIAVGILMARMVMTKWNGRRARSWCDRGVKALEQKDFPEAQRAFAKVVRFQPIWAVGRRLLAHAYMHAGDFTAAEEHLRFAAALEPRNPDGHMDLGLFLATCPPKRPEEAVDAFAKAVKQAPQLRESLAADSRLADLHDHETFRRLLEKD